MRRIAIGITATLTVIASFLLVPPAQAAFPAQNAKIAFTSNRDGNYEIYTINSDGSGQTRLTNNAVADFQPAWSPDGTKIAFVSHRDGNFEIYVMSADGSGQTRLTDNPASDISPAWSPDARTIAFTSYRDGNVSQIYLMNSDGSGQTDITNNATPANDPAFSPDGKRIVFSGDLNRFFPHSPRNHSPIFTMAPDGSNVVQLTNSRLDDSGPTFSPDGQMIAFARNIFHTRKIFTMAIDGSGQTMLNFSESRFFRDDTDPTFSPDGQRIAFSSDRDGPVQFDWEIYTMAVDGVDVVRLTSTSPFDNQQPDWQHGPSRSAYKNAAQFCKAEQAFWGAQFASRHGGGANAHGKCVSGK